MAGRPPKYDNPEDLQKKVDGYFDELGDTKPTITGLVLYLGFESRDAFYKYEKKDLFRYTIKKAHLRIEQSYEQMIHSSNVAGPIFALKNLGWKDRTEQDINVRAERPLFGPLKD